MLDREQNYYKKEFWKQLPTNSYIKLLTTIFLIFSIIGYASDIFEEFKFNYTFLGVYVGFSGILGVLYAHSIMRKKILLPFVLTLHLFALYYLGTSKQGYTFNNIPQEKFIIFGIALLFTIIIAYMFLIFFISGEGIPHIKLKTEMELAKKMHETLVPSIKLTLDKFEISGKSIPFSDVGGDLIDINTDEDNILCYIADVAGHGVSSGLFMGMFKSSVHTVLLNSNSIDQIFNLTNKSLSKLKRQNIFLTAAAINFHNNYTAEFLVAGHLPILHFKSQLNEIRSLTTKQIPVSVKGDFTFESEKIEYGTGDIFVLISDGITETFNNRNQSFEIKKIEEIIEQNNIESPNNIMDKIFTSVNNFGKQTDDQSILIIKCK